MRKRPTLSILLVALMLGPLAGIGGDPDCSHPTDDVCSGEDRVVCSHPVSAGDTGGPVPTHEDCPVGHTCSHPCGHLLSHIARAPADAGRLSRAEAFLPRLGRNLRSGFTVPPFHPPKPLS